MFRPFFWLLFFSEKGYNMWKKHFLVYIFFFGKKWIICAKTFFELFFNKKILLEKKTIICDWDYFLCVKDLLLRTIIIGSICEENTFARPVAKRKVLWNQVFCIANKNKGFMYYPFSVMSHYFWTLMWHSVNRVFHFEGTSMPRH